MKKIEEIAAGIGISSEFLEKYGNFIAKVNYSELNRKKDNNGKLILVTSINPTPAGEGKTTTTIGLCDALNSIGKKACAALREPSMGPYFGIKGGASGGGKSVVVPEEDINLHFTGDIHAVTSANNLISAVIDNSLFHGNPLDIDEKRIFWKRAMDMNDRSLRKIVIGLGETQDGITRQDGFLISVASEIMAILCLSESEDELRENLGNILVALKRNGEPVFLRELKIQDSLISILRNALKPNIVQTGEGNPVFIHGGPFANIAHGCNSINATRTALSLCDYTVTEAGFGADLGFEKFIDIKCRKENIYPDCAVIVVTVKALRYHGKKENSDSLDKGLLNLERHIENLSKTGIPFVVNINRFDDDNISDIDAIRAFVHEKGVKSVVSDNFRKGSQGCMELAREVIMLSEKNNRSGKKWFLYETELSIKEKIDLIVRDFYGGAGADFSESASRNIRKFEKMGFSHLPVCIAKTQYSFSDNKKLLGKPEDFRVSVNEINLSSGAGFIVAICGNMMTMPGLPENPGAVE